MSKASRERWRAAREIDGARRVARDELRASALVEGEAEEQREAPPPPVEDERVTFEHRAAARRMSSRPPPPPPRPEPAHVPTLPEDVFSMPLPPPAEPHASPRAASRAVALLTPERERALTALLLRAARPRA